ncbi:MAG: Uma2 family endonuclease [Oscillospiraceae bacterium]|nr:Uma2 family endonuclease [Oscillospiraceae bacterium]
MNGNLAYDYEAWEEKIGGKIIAMSPRPNSNHNFVSGSIYSLFSNYLKGKPCLPIVDGMDVFLTEDDTVVPDVMIVCDKDKIKRDGLHGVPDLVVEVISPTTVKRDRGYKKELYEKCGVKEYWIVDPNNCIIEVYLLKDARLELDDIYTLYPDYMLSRMSREEKDGLVYEFSSCLFPDMKISLEDIFENVMF